MLAMRTQRFADDRGVTALEAVMATAIFAVIVAMAFLLTSTATRTFDEQILTSDLQTKGERGIRTMQEIITEAQTLNTFNVTGPNGDTFHNAGISFQVPCTYNTPTAYDPNYSYEMSTMQGSAVWSEYNANPAWTPNGVTPKTGNPGLLGQDFSLFLKWGWRDDNRLVTNLENQQITVLQGPGLKVNASDLPAGIMLDSNGRTPGGYMVFQFVQDPNANVGLASPPGVFDEALEGIDIDGDGQLNSKYAVGYIQQAFYMGAPNGGQPPNSQVVPESQYQLAASNVLQPLTGNPNYADYNNTVQANSAIIQGSQANMTTAYNIQTNLIFVVPPVKDSTGQPVIDPLTNQPYRYSQLNISYFLLSFSENHKIPHAAHCQTTVFLRNNVDTSSNQGYGTYQGGM
jgi:hypothetical protein